MNTSRSRRTVRVAGLAAAALSLSLLVGCASSDSTSGKSSDKESSSGIQAGTGLLGVKKGGTPVEGGWLTYADVTEARSLDPTKTYATASAGGTPLAAVYDVLVRWNPESNAFEPWLAEGLEANADHTSWTLTLREGVTFSDGTALDAAAVVASVNRFVANNGSDAPLFKQYVTGIEAQGKDTVVFTMKAPWSTFPNMLAQGAGMVVAPAGYADEEAFTPIGAGPFTLDSYKPAEELKLKANPGYWKGKPHLDGLRFVVPSGSDAVVDNLLNSDVDGALLIYPGDEKRARAENLPGYRGLNSVHPVMWVNNREGAAGADLRVRQAIQLATDASLYNERVDKGQGEPSTELFTDASVWSNDAASPEENVEKATELVEQAKADGFDGELVYVDDTDNRSRNEAAAIKPMLERVGFTVNVQLTSSVADKMKKIYVDHEFDIATGGLAVQDADPFHRLFSGLSSSSFANVAGYSDKEMDALLVELQAAADDAARKTVVQKIEQRWYDSAPGVSLAGSNWYVTWRPEVRGVVPAAEFMMLFGEAWLEK